MSKEYKLPMSIAVALNTDRGELVRLASDDDIRDCRELLQDLINDRRQVAIELERLRNKVKGSIAGFNSFGRDIEEIADTLYGRSTPEDRADLTIS